MVQIGKSVRVLWTMDRWTDDSSLDQRELLAIRWSEYGSSRIDIIRKEMEIIEEHNKYKILPNH